MMRPERLPVFISEISIHGIGAGEGALSVHPFATKPAGIVSLRVHRKTRLGFPPPDRVMTDGDYLDFARAL
jgi:hypothetical protein